MSSKATRSLVGGSIVSPYCAGLVLGVCLLSCAFAFGQAQVLTEHNDVLRSGANTAESVLTTANVNSNTFGKLFTQPVDGFIVGQPLYLSAVHFPDSSIHNVVYVATQHDGVFAFDGDSSQPPLWNTSFINPAAGVTTVPIADFGCAGTAFTEIGIVSTPVIDPVAGTLFVLAKTLENGAYIFRLHALSTTTGADVIPPAVISASVTTNGGTLQFNPAIQMQRPALLLENGTVYIGFGSNGCDTFAYHGWLLAYNAITLEQVAAFATTPNGTKGAIWQAGGGPAADSDGTIFFATGNGTFDADSGGSDYGDSLLHLKPASGGLTVLDYFTPHDQETLETTDLDLGSGGVLLLPDQDQPHTHELLGGGKAGTLYVVDRDGMGGYNTADDSQIVQSKPGASSGELDSVPAYWNGNVYIGGEGDHIKAFSLSNNVLSAQPTSQTLVSAIVPGSVSITASGSNGILWAIPQNNPATVYAFDALNLSTMLYNSSQAGLRDRLGSVPKFVAPTIANGKVYIGGTSTLSVYGLLPLISPSAGNNQSAFVGTTLPVALQVKTVDAYQGNPIANASVTCKDGGVGGIFSAVMPMMTDSQGQASTSYTLPKRDQTITITCTSGGFASASFSETAIAGPVTRDIIVSGNNQTGPVSTQLPAALVVQILDPFSFGVPGVAVTFSDGSAGGTFSSASVITDSLGEASTFYTTSGTTGAIAITASTTGLAPLRFSEVASAAAPGYTLGTAPGTLSVVQGSSVPNTITVNPTGGFTGSVSLAASGLPSGVTASFNPSSTTSTSMLTLTASSSATTGPGTVTVTGMSGSLVQTATINLTVSPAATYSLAPAPSTLSVAQGSSVPTTITVSPTAGFTGSVSLAASGLPSGVTASFNPASTASTSTLTLSASSAASTGPATLTITGTSGSLVQTATINLTVTPPPSYSLSAGVASPTTVKAGGTATAPLTVATANGYVGSVTLSCSISPIVSPAPTCSFGSTNPVAVTASGGNATLTFTTIGPSAASSRNLLSAFYAMWLPGLALTSLSLRWKGSRRKNLLGCMLLCMVLATIIVLPACGGSGNSGGGGNGSPGTPAGIYTITVTGTDANNVPQSNTAPPVSVTVE